MGQTVQRRIRWRQQKQVMRHDMGDRNVAFINYGDGNSSHVRSWSRRHTRANLLPIFYLSPSRMAFFGLGTVLYVSLLMINAIAILNEDRFLAKSKKGLSIGCLLAHAVF